MQRRQIIVNAAMSVVQIVLISVILFILYRFLLRTIGVEKLGIWSIILATTSVTQIASFGLSGSVVKFVAKYLAREEIEKVSEVIQSAILTVAPIVGCALLIGYPIMRWALGFIIPADSLQLSISILPYAFLSLWIMTITGIVQAGLDGYQRIDIRSALLISGALVHLILCFLLAPSHGLIGLAYARIATNLAILITSWLLLRRYLAYLPIIPMVWNWKVFREIIGYGTNFQIMSVTAMFYDPVTKALLSRLGNLSMVGYYEMASRMVIQLRSIIVAANQVLVPAIAHLKERTPEVIESVYLTSYHLLFYLSVPLFSVVIISAPLISILWIGHHEQFFVICTLLLSVGWFLNTLNAPAYCVYLGIGQLRWNVISHISIALLNIVLGFLLGVFYDGTGVVVAWVISLALGSSVIYISYHLFHKIPLRELLPQASRKILMICLIGILVSFLIQYKFNHSFNTIALNSVIIFTFLTIIFFPLWFHPMRRRLMGWVSELLLKRSVN